MRGGCLEGALGEGRLLRRSPGRGVGAWREPWVRGGCLEGALGEGWVLRGSPG